MQVDLSDPARPVRWWRWLPVWAAVTVLYAVAIHTSVGVPLSYALRSSAVQYGVLAAMMVPVSVSSRRLMATRRHPLVLVLAHAAMGLAAVVLWQGAVMLYFRAALGPRFWDLVYARNWVFQLINAIAIYGTALSVTLTAQSWRRERERERREAALQVTAREAELIALKAQFQPHFVLNALNSLLALIDSHPALARTMVVRLSDLMKSVFDRLDVAQVPLERELDLVRAYLDVERIRLGSRLSVTCDIDDAARGVMVPPFVLQPIVENAVKHGVAPYSTPGSVTVTARVEGERGERVRVTIADSRGADARGPRPARQAAGASTGRGLLITRRRLDTVYGGAYTLTLVPHPSGMSVSLDLPAGAADVA